MSTIKMTCNRCGAGVEGALAEVLAWDERHSEHCLKPKPTDSGPSS